MASAVCAGQTSQFQDLSQVQATGGRVMSFSTGTLQNPPEGADILYVNAPVGSGAASSVTVGEQLNQGGSGFVNLTENQIVFTGASSVAAAAGNFMGLGIAYAFAITSSTGAPAKLCLYGGTGAQPPSPTNPAGSGSSFSSGNAYPPVVGGSGCMTLATAGANPPRIGYIAAFPLRTGLPPQLVVEDTANNYLYVLSLASASVSGGVLNGVVVASAIQLAAADGAGPVYVGDFNGDGNTDLIVNGQMGASATVYLGNGNGAFDTPARYVFDAGVRSLLIQDMDGDGIADLVVENSSGAIEIHHGNGDGTFATASEGGTAAGANSLSGNGGRLAAIDPATLNILAATPIGLSVLARQSGTLTYALAGIYNMGPGRSSFALDDFYGTGVLDLAVDSAEGVAIVKGSGSGGFVTSRAYSSLAPALGAAVGKFRNATYNPAGNVDVVVGTGAVEAQLMTGNGDGTFNTFPGVVDPYTAPAYIPSNLWSNVMAGDFNGDGNLDIGYTLTGLPLPSNDGPGTYFQYGNGDGTFQRGFGFGGVPPNNMSGASAPADFNGDGVTDFANIDATDDETLIAQTGYPFVQGLIEPENNVAFSQVAAGFFKVDRASQQDLVFEQGANFIPYKNAQDGTGSHFTAMPALTGAGAPLYPSQLLLTDVDGDGNGDVVALYYNSSASATGTGPVSPNQLYIWWGNGDGTFSTPTVLALSRNYFLGAVADMNGDGLPDLVLSDGSIIGILYNQGGGSPANRTFGGEQHFLAGQGINSITLADVNGDGSPDLIAANGGATISNAVALGGSTASSLTLPANPADIDTGGITVLLNNINTQPVTGSVVATPDPSVYGATFTLTATLYPSAGVASPTGTVQFSIDGTAVGTGTLTAATGSSTATYVVPAGNTYAAGTHTLTAVYAGDAANSPATLTGTELITGGATTSAIQMCIGPTVACPAPPGVPSPVPAYTPALTMYYGQIWNGFFDASANDFSVLTGNVELIDTYTGPAAPPPNPLCSLPAGIAGACANSVGTTQGTSVGVNVLTAYYPGDASHLPSTSPPIAVTVLPDVTGGATLTGAPNPSPQGQPVTFTATLTGNYAAPTGTVDFAELYPPATTSAFLGTATLVPGSGLTSTATFTTTTLPLGTDTITAGYAATQNFDGSGFPTITETITAGVSGGFTLAVTPASATVGVGYSTLFTVTATGQNGFAQGVDLTCSNLPPEASCFFDTASLPAGGGTTGLVVTTTAPHSCGTSQPYFLGSVGGIGGPRSAPFALPALAGMLALLLPGRRRWLRGLLAVAAVAAVTQISGCTNCTDLGTRPATYTFQVTGTSTATGAVESQPVTITVTI